MYHGVALRPDQSEEARCFSNLVIAVVLVSRLSACYLLAARSKGTNARIEESTNLQHFTHKIELELIESSPVLAQN